MTWRAAANAVLSSLFEPPCAACARILPNPLEGAVCESCWAQLDFLPTPAVLRPTGLAIDALCSIGEYDGRLRDIIHALKYDHRRSISRRLGSLMRVAGGEVLRDADLVAPVPLHPRRERARGFNQADDLARALGPPVKKLLKRVVATIPQVELPAAERHRNVRDAFALCVGPSAFAGAVIVLVDDVSTTGATLDACAGVLKAGGAREVRAVTAARVATARH